MTSVERALAEYTERTDGHEQRARGRAADPAPRQPKPDDGASATVTLALRETSANEHNPSEHLTAVERGLRRLPLPYIVTALLVAAILGPPGSLLVAYLETGDFRTSVESYFHGYLPAQVWQQIVTIVLWFAFYFALLWSLRRASRAVTRAETALAPVLPDNEAYHEAFRGLTALGPTILIGLAMYALFFVDYRLRILEAPGPFSAAYEALSGPPFYLIVGTAVWVHVRAMWGLHRLGRGELRLLPFYEDKTMGLRPMASLSLSLSAGYFALLLIMVLMLFIGPVRPEYVATVVAMVGLGLALFFLPLRSAHARMKGEKQTLQGRVREAWKGLLAAELGPGNSPDGPGASALPPSPLAKLTPGPDRVMTLEAIERKVAAVRTWPFDVPILSKLWVMALSIILALLTQVLKNLLGL